MLRGVVALVLIVIFFYLIKYIPDKQQLKQCWGQRDVRLVTTYHVGLTWTTHRCIPLVRCRCRY